MDIMYANQITIAVNEKEVVLRFACLAPTFDKNGVLQGADVANEKTILLTKEGFEKFKTLINDTKLEINAVEE